jgi:hypothetical protein
MDYSAWTGLLTEIVTPEGKVSYARLAERRDALARVVAAFGARSPQSHPEAFVSEEDQLAYWINAYNLFTLDAIVDEYPIPSVWKTRDGQFFQRKRHIAGGRAMGLDEIEHEILRGELAEPRIHFAINCGSNGCPALRPAAYEAEGIRATLRLATEQFLASEWNCRIDHPEQSIRVSRLFKMYAEDFAGRQGSSTDYRDGVLRFVADHAGVDYETIRDYRLRYNIYDWGLNDAARERNIGPILFHEPEEGFHEGDRELREIHLYEGNLCNRTCAWCTVDGSPDGWRAPYSRRLLDTALSSVARDGNLKFYGGEPTIHHRELIQAIVYLREQGFRGLVTIFSNGVLADRLIQVLESDAHSECVLNYSIYHGRDAEPLPAKARFRLEDWARENPGRLFQGYKVLFHAGSGTTQPIAADREPSFHGLGKGCNRCFPVLTTAGQYHACPFAAEVKAPHFDLGRAGDDPARVYDRYRGFRRWIDEELDPAAERMGLTSCEVCHTRLEELPLPGFTRD